MGGIKSGETRIRVVAGVEFLGYPDLRLLLRQSAVEVEPLMPAPAPGKFVDEDSHRDGQTFRRSLRALVQQWKESVSR
jgi:hypothetical protein